MNIKENRQKISDVMAIYIVKPTEENFKIIKNDLKELIYDNYYINFVEKCDDSILQTFFSDLIQTDNYNRIHKLTINPIGFFLYHPSVFSLKIPKTYQFLNCVGVKENDINNYFENVGKGIFNALFTLKTIPIVKYRTGWFAENIVNVIQENFISTFEKFPEIKEEFPKKNTLLVILDRETDLPIMLHHSAGLGSMMNDIFGLCRSKLSSNSTQFEIDPLNDFIWNNYLSTSFYDVREKIKTELTNISDQLSFLDDNKTNPEEIQKISEKLSATLESIRDLRMKQDILNLHVKFQEKLTEEINQREIGQFYVLENQILGTGRYSIKKDMSKTFYDLITLKNIQTKDINKTKEDVLRLCLIYFLVNIKITTEEINQIEKALNNIGQNIDSFEYLKQKRTFEESLKKGNNVQQSGFLSKSVSYLFTKVGSLMNVEQPSQVADLLLSLSSNKEVNNFISYNLLKKEKEKTNATFNQIIVFMVGGGSLAEYEYIDELMLKNDKNVTFI